MTRLKTVDPHEPSAQVHLDWLTAVFPMYDWLEGSWSGLLDYINSRLAMLGLGDLKWNAMINGLYRYPHAMVTASGTIICAYGKQGGYGQNDDLLQDDDLFVIQFSGQGLETYDDVLADKNLKLFEILQLMQDMGATFSRCDACCDFFNWGKDYSARNCYEEAKQGNLVTNSRRCRYVHEFSSRGADFTDEAFTGAGEGGTLYVGKNPKQLRIYNKLAERSEKVNLRYKVDNWSRWEFQLNGKHAEYFMEVYLGTKNLVQTWVDYLNSNFRFIEQVGHQARRERYPNATWFDQIVNSASTDELKVRTEHQKPSLEKSYKWIEKQVAPTLSKIFEVRKRKYLMNGVTLEDAKKLAVKRLMLDIQSWAPVDGFSADDEGQMGAWLIEHKGD